MTTALFTHQSSHQHLTPEGHPEQVGRIEAIEAALAAEAFAGLDRRDAPAATDAQLLRAHDPALLGLLDRTLPTRGQTSIDADTHMSPMTLEAARRAAGAVVAAVDAVLSGAASNAFCALRPPGHHAERNRAMGFCFFSNAAIGALHALAEHGLERVAILDFDVHHGNGTEDVVAGNARIFFASTHQWPLFPGTGGPGQARAENVLDVPLAAGTGSEAFRAAYEEEILPRAEAHRPELVIVSAGFDAHRDDPLASLALTEEDFAWVTARIVDLAASTCGGRIVSTLEGGYDLGALAASTAAHVRALMAAG